MIELHGCPVEVAIFEQVVHAHTDLQDAFIQVADLVWRGSPQQLECLVLIEELARVELVDGLRELWRGWRATRLGQVDRLQPRERKGYTAPTIFCMRGDER